MSSVKLVVGVLIGVVVVLAIVLPLVLLLPGENPERYVVTRVTEGKLVGVVTKEAGIFWGVPFSQPPLDEYRWRRPQNPVEYETGYWNATYKRPGCDQICDQPVPEYSCPHETSEDCLYLNVWVPSKLLNLVNANDDYNEEHFEINSEYLPGGEKKPLAVMVWFYGGNFRNGAGSCTLYDGRFMADKGNVIVVTTNYRVAQLGFLIQGTGEEESKGNFGFWDQVKTLEWVNKNIAMFGGDPKQVTLFGQSAGAESIAIHLTSNVSEHLFQKVIMHSNPFGLPLRNITDAKKLGDIFTKAAGCLVDDMVCLRSKTVIELEKAYNDTVVTITDINLLTLLFQPWSPVIDFDIVPDQPLNSFVQRKEQNKPMIMGATVDEAVIYVAELFPRPLNSSSYNVVVLAVFKEDYLKISAMYPELGCGDVGEECDYRFQLSELATEFLFECPQRKAINRTGTDRWLYMFNQTWSFYEAWDEPLCNDKVCHAADLAYIFGVEPLTTFTFTDSERDFSDRLIAYWTNFAKWGNPNQYPEEEIELKNWPKFKWDGPYQALQLGGDEDRLTVAPYNDICNFWDNLDSYTEHY